MRARGDTAWMLVRELRAAIVEGRLLPGERVGQAAIAKEFGVSRLPVREAFWDLQSQGLVTLVPNAGARVVRLDEAELEEIYWLRERLEPPLLAESVLQLELPSLERLRVYVDQMEAQFDAGDREGWEKSDREFHLLALTGASRPRMQRIVENGWNLSAPYRLAFIRLVSREEMVSVNMEHRLLLEAIEFRRPLEAELLLSAHIRRTRTSLRSRPDLFDGLSPAEGADPGSAPSTEGGEPTKEAALKG